MHNVRRQQQCLSYTHGCGSGWGMAGLAACALRCGPVPVTRVVCLACAKIAAVTWLLPMWQAIWTVHDCMCLQTTSVPSKIATHQHAVPVKPSPPKLKLMAVMLYLALLAAAQSTALAILAYDEPLLSNTSSPISLTPGATPAHAHEKHTM